MISQAPARSPRTSQFISGVALVVALLLGLGTIAYADPWDHHHIHYGASGSNWRARTHLGSTSAYDFHGLDIQAKLNGSGSPVAKQSATCGAVNEGCGTSAYSPYAYFPQAGNYLVELQICAYDDRHQMHPWDFGQFGGVCAGYNVHYHSTWL
jgi:hypothetical protein